jgi:hypothetical protein
MNWYIFNSGIYNVLKDSLLKGFRNVPLYWSAGSI